MSVITAMARNLRLELHARGILSLGRADRETIIAAVVKNTAELAKALDAKISRPTDGHGLPSYEGPKHPLFQMDDPSSGGSRPTRERSIWARTPARTSAV
jgi:hypothetical protein